MLALLAVALLAPLACPAAAQQPQPQQLPWWWELSAPDDGPAAPAPGAGSGASPSSTVDPFAESTYEPCECGAGRSCVCVLYYQCQNDTIITTGAGILDDRINTPKVERCPGVQRCCQEPPRRPSGGQPPATPATPATPTPPTPPYVDQTPVTPTPKPPVDIPTGPVKSGCGVRRGVSPASGNGTAFAEFPWMLVVQEAVYPGEGKPPAFVFKCGASLVHPQVALTAAHCVKRLIPSDVRVRAGIWDLTATAEPLPHQERRVIKIIRHPLFEEKTLFNDIALLVLDKTFDEALNVEVTCLPPPSVDFTGLRCIATGWGTSSPDTEIVQTTMKKVELPIVARDRCENELRMTRLGRYFELHESFICAGGEPNVDTCRGSLLHNTGYTEAVPAERAFIRKTLQEKDDFGKLPTDTHSLPDNAYRMASLRGSGTYKRHSLSQIDSIPNYGKPEMYTQFLNTLGINPNVPGLQWLSQFLPFTQQGNPLTNGYNPSFNNWNPFTVQGTQSENRPNPLTPGKFPHKNVDQPFGAKDGPLNSAENYYSTGGAFHGYEGNPDKNVGNWYSGYNEPGSNTNSGNLHASDDNKQSYSPNHQNFPGPNHQNFPGPNHQNFPGPNHQNFPGPNHQNFPGPNHQNFPGPNHQNFPGSNHQNFPGPNHQNFPGPNHQNFPGPNHQNFPGPNHQNFPGPNHQNFPGPNHQNFPGPNHQNFPGPNHQNFPGPNHQNFPGPNHQNFPGPNHQNFPGPNHQNFPGPNHQNFPGPNHQNFPGPNHQAQENANKDKHKNPRLSTVETNSATPPEIGDIKRPQANCSGDLWLQDCKVCSAAVTPINGDGGGPLVCPISGDDGRYIQVGIVSWGIGCGGSRTPAVYASLSYFRDWVDKQLEDNLFKNIAIPPPSVEEDERLKVPKPTWG